MFTTLLLLSSYNSHTPRPSFAHVSRSPSSYLHSGSLPVTASSRRPKPVSQSVRLVAEAPYLKSHTEDKEALIFHVGMWRAPCSSSRDNNLDFWCVHDGNCQNPTVLFPFCPSISAPKCSDWAGNAIAAVSLQGEAVAWQHL